MPALDGRESPPAWAYRGRRVAVLGASGFIGRWVARVLSTGGAQVWLITRRRAVMDGVAARYGLSGEIVEVDLAEPRALTTLLEHCRPSITFNLAGYGVRQEQRDATVAHQVNARLVDSLCEALAGHRDPSWNGQDLVHVGSALEYGTVTGHLAEDSTPDPTTVYGRSKLAGTLALVRGCDAYGLRGLTARLFTVYGPGEPRGRLLPSLRASAATGTPVPLTRGTQRRDFTYVEDVAEGLLRLGLVTTDPGQIVNLATGRLTTVRAFAETAAAVLGIPPERLQFGTLPTHPEEMNHAAVAVARLAGLVARIPPTGVRDGIRRTVAFAAVHGEDPES